MSAMRPGLPKARCAPWSGTAPRCCWPGAVDSATRWERSAPMPADRSRRAFRTTSPCYALATRRHSGWTPGVFWRRLRSLTCGLMRAGCCSALSVRPYRCKRTQTQDDGDLRCRGRGYGSGAARDLRRCAILTYDAALLASGGEPGRLKVTRGGPPGHVRPALAE